MRVRRRAVVAGNAVAVAGVGVVGVAGGQGAAAGMVLDCVRASEGVEFGFGFGFGFRFGWRWASGQG